MFKHILVPLDGSRFAEAALPYALEIAQKFESKITLFRVVPPPHGLVPDAGVKTADLIMQLRAIADQEAEEYVQSHAGSLRQQGYKVDWAVADDMPPADAILQTAENKDVDGIVMSTHGRSGLGRWVFGSVAEKVLRHASAPVLLIRAKE